MNQPLAIIITATCQPNITAATISTTCGNLLPSGQRQHDHHCSGCRSAAGFVAANMMNILLRARL
jgi:hypothetical protein